MIRRNSLHRIRNLFITQWVERAFRSIGGYNLILLAFAGAISRLEIAMSLPPPESSPATNATSARWFVDEVHAHDSALRTYLRRAFPQARNEVEDLVQESYLRIWRARADRPYECARAFLFKIARHVAIDLIRRHRASPIEAVPNLCDLAWPEETSGAPERLDNDERERLLVLALRTLPPRGREVVILRKFEGLSQKQTATKLGIAEKTVDEHLYRGLKRLGEFLRQHGVTSLYNE